MESSGDLCKVVCMSVLKFYVWCKSLAQICVLYIIDWTGEKPHD